jgi:hypothetical protein
MGYFLVDFRSTSRGYRRRGASHAPDIFIGTVSKGSQRSAGVCGAIDVPQIHVVDVEKLMPCQSRSRFELLLETGRHPKIDGNPIGLF